MFLLTRSGFAGLQRYSTATWSGDIGTRWEDMKAQISAGLNFAMSGIPYWTMDIGGFCVENRYVAGQKQWNATKTENADYKEWRELNTRWYQFGAFVPLYRAHGQYPFREIWEIAPEGHPAYQSVVYYYNLYSDVQRGENVVVEIPVQAGEKHFKYEQKVKLVNPKLYGRGYAIGDMGHTDYVLVADDIVAVEEK